MTGCSPLSLSLTMGAWQTWPWVLRLQLTVGFPLALKPSSETVKCSKPSIYSNSLISEDGQCEGVTLVGCSPMVQAFPVADGSLVTGREHREKLANYTPAQLKRTFLAGKAVHFRDSSQRTRASPFSQPQWQGQTTETETMGLMNKSQGKVLQASLCRNCLEDHIGPSHL